MLTQKYSALESYCVIGVEIIVLIQSGTWVAEYILALLFNRGDAGLADLKDFLHSRSLNVAPELYEQFQARGYL